MTTANTTTSIFTEADRIALAEGAAAIGTSGMVVGSAGNLSIRRGDRVLITPGGAQLERIDPVDMVDVALADGSVHTEHAADSKPSSESALHRSIYERTGARAIVHTHAHYATVLSTLVDEVPPIHYVIAAFGGPVRVARYETFGTGDLAGAVVDALDGRTAALMANHGAVVLGRDVESAVGAMRQLEWLCSVYYHAIAVGRPQILSAGDIDAVRDQVKRLRYGMEVPSA